MKIFFIASSVYILYLMKSPFRPTFDPNLDTFKVEFLVLGSFVAAMVFNYAYSLTEVLPCQKWAIVELDSLVVQHLARECCDTTPVVHYSKDWGGRKHYYTLFICSWRVSSTLHSELDVSILCGGLF